MDFQAQLNDWNAQLNEFFQLVQRYFKQLNEYETYGWIAEGVGLLLIIVGIVLLFF
jgi:hypothetical protein